MFYLIICPHLPLLHNYLRVGHTLSKTNASPVWEQHISHLPVRCVVRIVQHILDSLRMASFAYYLVHDPCTFCSWFQQHTLLFSGFRRTAGLCCRNHEWKVHESDQITHNNCRFWAGLGPILFLIGFVVVNWLVTLHTAHVCHA
jgi:hypothetical protein